MTPLTIVNKNMKLIGMNIIMIFFWSLPSHLTVLTAALKLSLPKKKVLNILTPPRPSLRCTDGQMDSKNFFYRAVFEKKVIFYVKIEKIWPGDLPASRLILRLNTAQYANLEETFPSPVFPEEDFQCPQFFRLSK